MASTPTRYLRMIAGGDKDLENEDVATSTRFIYGVKGQLLVAVSVMSAAIAGYTWSEVFHLFYVGIMVACIWFVISLSLNMVISWRFDQVGLDGKGRWVALGLAAVLGFTIAAVNSQFMLMRVLDSEIKAYIAEKFHGERAGIEQKLADSRSLFDRKIDELRAKAEADKRQARADAEKALSSQIDEVSQLRERYQAAVTAITTEVDGRAPSKKEGEGSRARQKRLEAAAVKALLDASTARLDQERARLNPQVDQTIRSIDAALVTSLQEVEEQKKAYEGRLTRDLQEMGDTPREGFLQRSAALTAVAWQQPVWAGLFFLLFAIIESMVVLLKLLTGKTDYHRARLVQQVKQRNKHDQELAVLEVERMARALLDREAQVKHREAMAAFDETERNLDSQLLQRILEDLRAGGATSEDALRMAERRLLEMAPRRLITKSS